MSTGYLSEPAWKAPGDLGGIDDPGAVVSLPADRPGCHFREAMPADGQLEALWAHHQQELCLLMQRWGEQQAALLRTLAVPPPASCSPEGMQAHPRSRSESPRSGEPAPLPDGYFVNSTSVPGVSAHSHRSQSAEAAEKMRRDSGMFSDRSDSPRSLLRMTCSSESLKESTFKQVLAPNRDDAAVGWLRAHAIAFVAGKHFEAICSFIIVCNSVSIAYATEWSYKHYNEPENTVLKRLEQAYLIFYSSEVFCRIFAFRREFFTGKDCRWNLFDVFLVAFAAFDQVVELMSQAATPAAKLSFFRVMRLTKMFRLLRVVRLMRRLHGLRLVLNSMMGSMQAMLYAMILIVATTFMFGTAILQSCTTFLQAEEADEQTREEIAELWCSIPRCMLSLFMASTSGDSWRVLARPLEAVGPFAYFTFVVYIAFFAFVIANTLTSLFVENSLAFAASDENLVVQQELEKKDDYIQKLRRFFDLCDSDGSGEITYEEFANNLSSPILHAFATSLDIEIHDTRKLFRVISADGTHPVDVDTFVISCIRLKGNAKSMDLFDLMNNFKKTSRDNLRQIAELVDRIGRMESSVESACSLLIRRQSASACGTELRSAARASTRDDSPTSKGQELAWRTSL